MSKAERVALAGIAIAALLGIFAAWAGSDGGSTVAGIPAFAILVAAAFTINVAAFIPSYLAGTEHYYDLTGSLTYIGVTTLALITAADLDARSIIAALMIYVWAGRLGTFLFRRVRASGKDGRFDRIKTSFVRFLMAWMLQGLWVTLTAGAALAAITSGAKTTFGVLGVVGLVVWIVGFAIEVVADSQKTAFRREAKNAGDFITTGLWSWSRHPNYFGEIVLWTGMAIMVLPALAGLQHLTLISPLFVAAVLLRISGVPMLERRADAKWGAQHDYERYKATTPVLIPRPPSSAG